MLELIRKKIHGVFAWILLISIAVVFIFWGTVGLRLTSNNFIDVNGEKIYQQDLAIFKSIYPNADLVQVTLGVQELNKAGFFFSENQIDDRIKNSPIFQIDGKFSNELYQRYLSNNVKQLEAIRKGVYFNSLTNQMYYALQTAQANFPSSTEWYYKLMDQKRNVSVLTVNQDKFIKDIQINEDEMLDYFNKNKNNYIEPAKVKIEYVKLHYPEIVKQIKLTDEELKGYFESNLEQYKISGQKKVSQIVINNEGNNAKNKLDKVLEALKNDDKASNFGSLAKQYSDDKLTAKKEGDAGWFQPGDMGVAVLDKAVAELSNINTVSEVVSHDNSWYLFKLVDKKPEQQQKFEDVKDDIQLTLSEQKANAIYSDLKERLELKSYEIADSLEIVAEELGVSTFKSDWFNSNGFIDSKALEDDVNAVINNPKIFESAFSEDVLDNRNNSSVIEINAETAVVIRLSDYVPQSVNDYSIVKDQVKTSLANIKATAKAKDYAEKLWTDFINNTVSIKKLEELAKGKYVKLHKSKSVTYFDTFYAGGTDESLKQGLISAFELPKPDSTYPLQAKLLHMDNGNQAILAVDNVVLGEYQKATDQQKDQTANQLKYLMFLRDNANFFNRVYSSAKVETNL